MTYSLPQNSNFFTFFRQPTGLAIMASVGIHGIVGVGLEQVPILSKQTEISPVQLVELTPEQLSFLPEFSQPELAAMKFDTLVPPSPGDVRSGLPVLPAQTEPLKPWTLPEGSSLYNSQNNSQNNSQTQAKIPSFPNWPPAPPPINSTPLNQNSSSTGSPQIPQRSPDRSPSWEEILSQLPPPPPASPSNNQYNWSSQLPPQQVYTVPSVPIAPPELPPPPQVETFNGNFPPSPGFNPQFPATQVIPPAPETIPQEPEFQANAGMNRDELAMNSPTDSPLPSGLNPGQQTGSSQDLLDTQQAINPNLVIPPGEQNTPNQVTDENSLDIPRQQNLTHHQKKMLEYQQQLRQELASQTTANQSERQAEAPEASTQPQQTALLPSNPPDAKQQPATTNQSITESSTQQTVTQQQPAQSRPEQTTIEPNSQSVPEVTEPEVKQPAVVATPKPEEEEELTYHQQQILAYHQQLVEQKRLDEQGGSLSDEEEAMLAGGEEFYTWFLQLRQELPDLTPKTPSSIADNYPLAACPEKLAGRAVVGTVVNPNGDMIESPKVLSGSGSQILDDAALTYVESVKFSANERPTAYQYSFEFNYNREICAIAQPETPSQNPQNHSEAVTGEGEIEMIETEGMNPTPEIEAMEDSLLNQPTGVPEIEGNQSETETEAQASSEPTQDRGDRPSNPLTLEPQPGNPHGYDIYTPVPLPATQSQ